MKNKIVTIAGKLFPFDLTKGAAQITLADKSLEIILYHFHHLKINNMNVFTKAVTNPDWNIEAKTKQKIEPKIKGKVYIEFNTITYADLKEELGEFYDELETSFVIKISNIETHVYNKCKNTGIWIKGIQKLNV